MKDVYCADRVGWATLFLAPRPLVTHDERIPVDGYILPVGASMKWRGISTDSAEKPASPGALRDRLLEIKAGIAQYVRPENQAINDRVISELQDRKIARDILAVGSAAPEFALPDQHGVIISSRE